MPCYRLARTVTFGYVCGFNFDIRYLCHAAVPSGPQRSPAIPSVPSRPQPSPAIPSRPQPSPAVGSKKKQATRGFEDDLDETCQGILNTYRRKLRLIDLRYSEVSAKDILKKLLGADVSEDEPVSTGRNATVVTGEQGGKLMACFLYKIHEDWEHASQDDNGIFSDAVPSVKMWLEKQQPRFVLHPAQKKSLQWALKFLPKLEAGLNEAQAARRGSLNSDTDEDSPPPEPDFD